MRYIVALLCGASAPSIFKSSTLWSLTVANLPTAVRYHTQFSTLRDLFEHVRNDCATLYFTFQSFLPKIVHDDSRYSEFSMVTFMQVSVFLMSPAWQCQQQTSHCSQFH